MSTNDPNAKIFNPHTNAPRSITSVEHYPPRDMHTGWICPKCQQVHSPRMKSCPCTSVTPIMHDETYCENSSNIQTLNEG